MEIIVPRPTNTFAARVQIETGEWFEGEADEAGPNILSVRRDPEVLCDVTHVRAACRRLGDSVYLGAFRNAIQAGATAHYDLQIGEGFIQAWDQFKVGPLSERTRPLAR
jgi:hypothetical protein